MDKFIKRHFQILPQILVSRAITMIFIGIVEAIAGAKEEATKAENYSEGD
jgi:hypothetical protein